MADSVRPGDRYLREVSIRLAGSRRTRRRLLAELRGHLDDAVEAHVCAGMQAEEAERHAIERLGPVAELAETWERRCVRLRSRQRRHIAVFVGTITIASVLGVVQHADGRRDPTIPVRHCAGSTLTAPVFSACERASEPPR